MTFRMGEESLKVSTLASPSKAVQWNGELRRMGHCQVKQSSDDAHACDDLAGDLLVLEISPSSHLNSYSSHLNARLLL